MIPPKQVQEILDAVRIEDVVQEFVTLRKRGVNMIGLCPFHGEKTPSFNVSPARNIFKCFGCGKGGDAVTFPARTREPSLMWRHCVGWPASTAFDIQEVERSPEQMAELQLADSLYIVNDFALQHFQDQLFNTDEGKSVALVLFQTTRLARGHHPGFRARLCAGPTRPARAPRQSHGSQQRPAPEKVGLCNQDGTRDFFRGVSCLPFTICRVKWRHLPGAPCRPTKRFPSTSTARKRRFM
jgi:hypothetical protein